MTAKEYAIAAAKTALEWSVDNNEPGWANNQRWQDAFNRAMAECEADELRAAAYDDAETFGREVAQ
jgi:hypothetical protein